MVTKEKSTTSPIESDNIKEPRNRQPTTATGKISNSETAPKKSKECCSKDPFCKPDEHGHSKSPQTHGTHSVHLGEGKRNPKTRVTVKFDVGFGNSLSIRGNTANLNWNKGIALKNVKADEWTWETDASFNMGEFKVLINDKNYELGENHTLKCGATIQYTPKF